MNQDFNMLENWKKNKLLIIFESVNMKKFTFQEFPLGIPETEYLNFPKHDGGRKGQEKH